MASPISEEDIKYIEEARKITREYLSGMMWVRANRDTLYREVRTELDRDVVEQRFGELTRKEEDVEWKFGQAVDGWNASGDAKRWVVLEEIVKTLGHRRDLGFFGSRIVDRLKRQLELQ